MKGLALTNEVSQEEEDGLDEFETDGFIVFDDEEEEEGQNDQDSRGKQKKEKKRKRRLVKKYVLDDDDIELLEENRISGICQFSNSQESGKFKRLKNSGKNKVVEQSDGSDDEGLFLDEVFRDEEAEHDNEENEMANFIVDDEISYKDRSPMSCFKKNQNKLEQAVTLCSYELNDEILNKWKQVIAVDVKLDDSSESEPFFLADKYILERDNHILETDMPERMQMIEEIAGPLPVDEMSREEDSAWILNQLLMNSDLLFCTKRTSEISSEGSILLNKIKKEHVMKFLELHHVEKFDIPFIAMYRKDQCLSLLDDIEQDEEADNNDDNDVGQVCQLKRHKLLWVIKELDRKWLLLQKRKSALKMYQRRRYDEECLNIDSSERYTLSKQLFESISKSLNKAESEEEIDDIDAKFSLHFPPVEERMDGKFKRPVSKSQYSNCMKAGLWKLANQFGCTSEQLSFQFALEKMDGEFQEHPEESPEEIALNFTCPMFETPELVLKGARDMAALEVSCEPCIKTHIRSIFMNKAVISTSPTPEGNSTIDSSHQFSGVKWLRDKPLSKFNDAQWLLIQKAEEEKLLQVHIKLPENTLNELITRFNDVYLVDGAGRSTQLWKEQCKLILHDALFNSLLPSMEKEVRNLLTSRAKHMLLMEFGKEFWKMVSVGPYLYNGNSVRSLETVAPKVMSCCWGPGNPATTFVMLDSSGELLHVLEARYFNLRSQTIDSQQRRKHDQQNVLRFMKNHQPNVVVIGANASCVRLKNDVKEVVSKFEENLRDLGQAMDGISVLYGDESLPQLYEHSQVSSDQLPGQKGIVKRAVALGRYLQNPLAMVATLCGANRDIASWKLSSLEHLLTPDEKYEMIEQVMVDVTNQVGVDINFALNHDWYFPLLQFVSGLGPQKAALLQREVAGYRLVKSRKELASFGLKTKKVFHNAVGFLCVCGSQLPCTSFDIDLLDGTRIHPESYELAERLAKAVCDDITEAPVEYVKKKPQVLSTFNINDYSANYETEEGENKRETFCHIKEELLHGFIDPRKPYKVPSLDEEFNMICGKNGTGLAEGRLVQAIVRHVQSKRAFCVLDSGLTGIIMKEDFSDEDGDFSLEDKLHEGDEVSCKVKQIDKITCQVFLTSKESELKNRYEDIHEVDPYYHERWSILSNEREKAFMDEKLAKKHFMPRTISHPFFRNLTLDQAMQFLSDKDAGESIFRPSSNGPFYLTLTLKVFDEVYVNKDIVESGKDHKDMTTLLHLGKILKIGNDTFGDLDEVMDRYVAPLVKHLKEMLGFRKFKRGAKAEVDEVLRAEKSEYPMRIVYCFGISYEYPGTFILSYIKSKNLHHEYVGLLPNGFKFRKQTFEKIEHLVGFFQKNIDCLQHRSPTLENLAVGNSLGSHTTSSSQGQLISSEDRSISRGRNFYHRDENDGGKMHPSELPRPRNGPGHGSSNYSFNSFENKDKDPCQGAGTKWSSCSEDQSRTNEKQGNEDWPGGWSSGAGASGGNWDRNGGTRNSEWGKGGGVEYTEGKWGQSGGRGFGDGCTSGWGNTKNGDSGGNDGVWRAGGGNNLRGRGRRGGRRGAHGSGWGATREGESGGSFGDNEGDWHVSGNNVGGHGRHGGGRDHGPGRGRGGRSGSWDGNRGGRRGGGRNGSGDWESNRGGYRGGGRNGRGRGRSNERSYNSHRESEFGQDSSNWGYNNGDNNSSKWSHDKKTNFPGSSNHENWGNKNVTNEGWSGNNAGAFAGGSTWERPQVAGNAGNGNGNSGSWDDGHNNGKGILGSRPDQSWGGQVAGNQGGWN